MDEDYRSAIQENFKRGTIDMVILYLLSKEELYGYQLNQRISELSHGKIFIKEGCLYPPIYRMKAKNFLEERRAFSESNMLRKYYVLTDAGKEYLKVMIEEYKILCKGVDEIFKA